MNPEIERHFERADLFLIRSEHHIQCEFYDDSINRSYYAMFHAITALLLTRNIVRSKHSGLIASFNQNFIKSGEFDIRFSGVVQKGFELRNKNDYLSAPINNLEDTQQLLHDAKDLVKACREYCNR